MDTVTNNPYEDFPFTITRTFLGQLHIECPGTPELILYPTEKTFAVIINTEVLSARISKDLYYMIEIKVNISTAIDCGLKAHDLMFVYVVFVNITDESLDSESIHKILNDTIPKSKYNDINSIVFNATNATGYPVVLDKKQFEESIIDKGTSESDDDDLSEFDQKIDN
ncbi:MAG: hypothetical protein IK004_02175 [Bacteroidales bacterium]|nr:hypothetical protein [Bacteroidales bacterium]